MVIYICYLKNILDKTIWIVLYIYNEGVALLAGYLCHFFFVRFAIFILYLFWDVGSFSLCAKITKFMWQSYSILMV